MYIVVRNGFSRIRSLFVDKRKQLINIPQVFVYHKTHYSHHGGTAVVQFFRTRAQLELIRAFFPANIAIERPSAEVVAWEFRQTICILNEDSFQEYHGADSPIKIGTGEVRVVEIQIKDSKSRGNVLHTRDAISSIGGDVTYHSKLRNTAVLEFCLSQVRELGIIFGGQKSHRIEESERSLSADFSRKLVCRKSGDRWGSLLAGGKGSRGGDEG
mmetsp:Transcript_12112/g.29573  ORF Transcript_12112/g.29573 Transcript_12112/m.29573 type:complete len:214 (-) Transcript_12112:178-819(-)